MKTRIAIVLAVALAVGCGDDPNDPSPQPTGLSITPDTTLIKIKGTETFSATTTFSDGGGERSVRNAFGRILRRK